MDSRLACDEVEVEDMVQAVSRVSCRVGYHLFEIKGNGGAPEHRLYAVVWSCCIIERRVRHLYGV